MDAQFRHGMLPEITADERARQEFVKSLKIHLATKVSLGNKDVYEKRVKPQFVAANGREPANRHEVRKVMEQDRYYQTWSSLQRTSQEMMWDSVAASVERQLPELIEKSKSIAGKRKKLGSLRLDPDLPIPAYHTAVDIHCMPGGYHTELAQDDVFAGAVYDRAVYIYSMGRMGDMSQDMGATVVSYLKQHHPDFAPKRILDMGCSVGNSTLPYARAFPKAEIQGIDVGAPMLRYAHARAESVGVAVHYSQQNAEKTDFPDQSFDLIVSHILLHETSNAALDAIMAEAHRLLRPGGIMLHAEVPQYDRMPIFDQFMLDWDTRYNNEPFWGTVHEKNLADVVTEAGFARENVISHLQPMTSERDWAKTDVFQCGDFGGGGAWFVFGAKK